ncbi:unnamed protein product [Paramecium primaurelia]|uniref:Uncharacterized protein n=1 Tax=Paramecium primaurelia TaxID=5886 RepID=A0A8S1N4X0_PARPR|nr:unnamed protein product [Paramecium primaurelia]CAD8088408.1 unnamed protein product [Paramecium primaurelia]
MQAKQGSGGKQGVAKPHMSPEVIEKSRKQRMNSPKMNMEEEKIDEKRYFKLNRVIFKLTVTQNHQTFQPQFIKQLLKNFIFCNQDKIHIY